MSRAEPSQCRVRMARSPLSSIDPAIAGVPGNVRFDRRAAVGGVLRKVRGAAAFTTAGEKVGGVLANTIEHDRIGMIVKPGDIQQLGRLLEDPSWGPRVTEDG